MINIKFLDLFAGIGGFRSGLEMAGHECVGFVEIDKFARKSYRAIYNTEGEWTAHDIRAVRASELPRADIWTFGFPCQDISVAGKQKGFAGKRSSLFFTVTSIIRDLEEEDRPSILLIENVKNLLSINGGWDFLKLQIELDEIGYDVEWDVLDTAEVLPQHRERVYIVGHLRGRGTRNVFPIKREGKPASDERQKINIIGSTKPANSTRLGQRDVVYDANGLMGTLGATDYKQPKQVGIIQRARGNNRGGVHDIAPTLSVNSYVDNNVLAIKEATIKGYAEAYVGDSVNISQPNSKTRRGRVGKQVANTLETGLNQGVVVPVLTPDRLVKRQNGRRFKTNGEPMFTLNTQDRHGITDWLRIRKLTPLECWRLQGFTDEQFYKAQAVNSNSQLYKQAGNSVSVPVVYAVAKHLKINS
ncbi:DNA cytosine methyltransferase [Latilactobacillus curvatus]|nr:DNA cytosine methyltransferase [Latilactobacillus curvatus]QAS49575.1 DNA (cytosine-5-)-methyltransferase [Latilactobacillus curvatus JCM 1096 = DSM 20019]